MAIALAAHAALFWGCFSLVFLVFLPNRFPDTIVVTWADEREYELLEIAMDMPVSEISDGPNFATTELQSVVSISADRTDEENLQELDVVGKRLEQISSAEAVDSMAVAAKKLFGTSDRATQPAKEPVVGKFDFDTAQMHDVRREKGTNDEWVYFAVLLDANGRTTEVVMPAFGSRSSLSRNAKTQSVPSGRKSLSPNRHVVV